MSRRDLFYNTHTHIITVYWICWRIFNSQAFFRHHTFWVFVLMKLREQRGSAQILFLSSHHLNAWFEGRETHRIRYCEASLLNWKSWMNQDKGAKHGAAEKTVALRKIQTHSVCSVPLLCDPSWRLMTRSLQKHCSRLEINTKHLFHCKEKSINNTQ